MATRRAHGRAPLARRAVSAARSLSAISHPRRAARARWGSSPMLPRRAVIMAHTLAAALALAAMWRPRGALLACSAADLAHVPVSRRVRGGYLMTEQRLQRLRSKDNLSTSRRDATIGAPGAALPGREMAASASADAGAGLRSEFLQVLLSRRRDLQVPLSVEKGSPVRNPIYQKPPGPMEAVPMESCPRKEVENFKEKLVEENFYLVTELGEQGRVPVLLLKLNDPVPKRKPIIVFLHSSYKCKEWLRPLLEAYASRGYICVAIDSRYHGERASNETTYIDALKSAWRNGDTMPFIFDTVWDLIKLGDHLSEREDVDPCRIGITGESLGGMHAWFAAFVDTRYSVTVPIIGVQGFRWAIDNNMWQARVNSIKPLFEEARIDLGKSEIDTEVVEKVWEKIAPGLDSQFDAPYSLPLIAPRPLLLLNGAEDPRCPIAGLEETSSRAAKAYEESGSAEKFMFIAEPRIGHQMTVNMVKKASDWFDRFLK
ncbi:hypothetical protein GQ55_4G327900 [Panicum hallii var. hallii]|uniref:Peptidase S9 prolyl oligopeptidase catalytic domain-containing protein n=1 Tax=Panicum hallii var. hallii TaxID=1504633 RepID=A0A2T7E2J8_9POAL|nr:hypothetical protein GQ55_4G327900 [Panicum hallii var. hallii]